jgi:hypothetical protein
MFDKSYNSLNSGLIAIKEYNVGQITMRIVHDVPQKISIYIFCDNKAQHEQWTKQLSKVEGVFNDILPIYEVLKNAVQECDHKTISISFFVTIDNAVDKNLDEFGQSFMCTQILKEF